MLGKNSVNDCFLGQCLAGFGYVFTLGLEVVHMKAQHVGVFNGVGDGVGVQLLLKNVFGGAQAGLLVLNLGTAGVVFKNGRARKAEQLSLGEKSFDGFVVLAKLRAVAFVKDENNALVLQRGQLLLVSGLAAIAALLVAAAGFIQCQA